MADLISVEMPNGDMVDFPSDLPKDKIKSFIVKHFPNDYASHLKQTAEAIQSGMNPFDYVGNVTSAIKSGYESIKKGLSPAEIESGAGSVFPSAPMDILSGVKQIVTSPITAASKAYGGIVEKGTGGIIPAEQAEISLMGLGPRAGRPVIGGVGPSQPLSKVTRASAISGKPSSAAVGAEKELSKIISTDKGLPGQIPQGKEEIGTLADIGGENVQGTVERLAQTPGAARAGLTEFLTDRQKGQLVRISNDLRELTGTKKTALRAVKDTVEARTAAAAPAYQAAFNAGDRAISSEELVRLTGAPEVQEAMSAAVKGWQRSQIADGYGAMNPTRISTKEVENTAVSQSPSGNIMEMFKGRVPVFPNLQFWDYTKNALDGMIADEIKADGTMTKKGRDLTIIVGKLRKELDAAVPEYEQARTAWGGRSSYLNHINLGKNIRKASAEEVDALMAGASEADKEAYRIGAVSDLVSTLGRSTAKLPDVSRTLSSPEMRGKISAIMPNAQAAAKWDRRLAFESKSSEMVSRALSGSPTFRRLAEAKQSEINLDEFVTDLVGGTTAKRMFGGMLMKGYSALRNKVRSQRDEEMTKLLLGRPSALRPPQ